MADDQKPDYEALEKAYQEATVGTAPPNLAWWKGQWYALGVDYPFYVSQSAHEARGCVMACGRWFHSVLHRPSDRKRRYWRNMLARHERRCTKCRKAWRVRVAEKRLSNGQSART